MSALKEKQRQKEELSSSQANLMVADFLIDLDNLKKAGWISDSEFQRIKREIFNCKVNASVSRSVIQNDLKNWIMFLKIGLIDRNTFCDGIKSILIYNLFEDRRLPALPALLSDEAPIKNQVINLSEVGCKIIYKDISRNKMTIVMKKEPYIITIIRYKSFFWREWKKKIKITDTNGNKYDMSSADFYNVVAKL